MRAIIAAGLIRLMCGGEVLGTKELDKEVVGMQLPCFRFATVCNKKHFQRRAASLMSRRIKA